MSQVLTLYTTPVIYLAMDWISATVSKVWRGSTPDEPHTPAPAAKVIKQQLESVHK